MEEPSSNPRPAAGRIGALVGGVVGALAASPPAVQLGIASATSGAARLPPFVGYLPPGAQDLAGGLATAAMLGISMFIVLFLGGGIGALAGLALARPAGLIVAHLPRRLRAWRPGWRAARITLLLCVLAGALVYADRRIGLPWPEATPPGRSAWLEREKSLFRGVLASQRYELLVLPIEAEEPSFDRIARSLMTRYLALRAGERTGAAMPDPTLVARAVGQRERRLDVEDVLALAADLGARTAIASKARRTGDTFSVQSTVWIREGGTWRQAAQGGLDKLAYSDRLPPSVSFRDAVDRLLDELRIGNATPLAESSAPAAQPALRDLRGLAAEESGSPAQRAIRLQILAALHERESMEAESLWERSLVALWRMPPQAEEHRVLEARAYLHLSRRPYALVRLGKPSTATGQALAAALDGNVPALEAAAARIEDSSQRLLAEVELADLYDSYNLRARLVERREVLLKPAWTHPAILGLRLSAPEWFRSDIHGALAVELAVDVSATARAHAWLRWLYMLEEPLAEYDLLLAGAVEQSYAPMWKEKGAAWAARPAADRPAEWDYYDLVYAANRRAAFKTVYATMYYQALHARAAAMIERLAGPFGGHPRLAYYQAWTLERLGRDASPGMQKRLFSRSSALAVSAYRWEGGESHVSSGAEHCIYERPYVKYLDEPPRWYRGRVATERLQFERLRFAAQEMEREIMQARRRLEYSDRSDRPWRDLVRWLRRAGRVEEALAAVEANRRRFVGSMARAQLIAEADAGGKASLALYREQLALDPDSWEARAELARSFLEAGDAPLALKTYAEFPGFKDRDGHNVVALSNRAFEAGYSLYRSGEPRHARPLFDYAAGLRTGAASEMRSRELLALLNDDLSGAAREAARSVSRYGDSYAGMRQALYLHLSGRAEQAEELMLDYAGRFGDEAVWMATFIAQRMQRVAGLRLEEWLAKAAVRDTRRDYLTGALRERHGFMMAYVDRVPSAEALALLRRIVQANNRSPFYPQLAEGYAAWRARDFALAADKLRGPHDDLFNISVNRRQSLNEWLPHVVSSYARSGRRAEAERLLGEHLANIGADGDYLAARALMEGGAGRHEAALASLRLAFYRLPYQRTRTLPPGYALLEAGELLHRESGNTEYRALLADLARRLQTDLPYPWAAAFQAKYESDAEARRLALAAASLLDFDSARIADVPVAEREAALKQAAQHPGMLGAALRGRSR